MATFPAHVLSRQPVDAALYVTITGKNKIRCKTLYFKGYHNNKGYYAGKNAHIFFMSNWFGDSFVMSKTEPGATKSAHVIGRCSLETTSSVVLPPADGWETENYEGTITLRKIKAADWVDREALAHEERIGKLCAILQKTAGANGKWSITIRDVCRNISAVKDHVPELLKDFAKIDKDGCGSITVDDLKQYFNPHETKEYSLERLDELWEVLVAKRTDKSLDKDTLCLEDMAANVEFVEEKLPQLFDLFGQIDTDGSGSIDRPEFNAFYGSADIWLEAKMQNIIGLEELKAQIKTFYWQMRLDRLRRKGGLMVTNDEAIVIMFKGSPGTGKTTIGRLLAGLLKKIDIIPTDTFVECQRDELVGEHLGATEKLTEAVIAKAKGGVLFVDEAYRLTSDIFGVEAINCLMKAMTVKGNVMILAGYPKQMEEFVTANPGLKRRITYEMTLEDYSPTDLAKILHTQVKKRGFQIDSAIPLETVSGLIDKSTSSEQRTCFNGGVGEHITRHAIFNLNASEVPRIQGCKKGHEPTPSNVLRLEDLQYGCTQIPAPPPPETFNFAKDAKMRPM